MYCSPEAAVDAARKFGVDLSAMQIGDTICVCVCGWKSVINPGAFRMQYPDCRSRTLWFFRKTKEDI